MKRCHSREFITRGTSSAALVLAVQAALTPGAVQAQEPRSTTANLDEIVVTARKAEEKLGEVPVSITAFTAADLAARNVSSLSDVAQYTAGFSFESYVGGSTPAPTIRGLAQTALTNRDQNVGTFVDGVYIQQQGNIDFSLMELERVEIVKGPQSSQYGRSTFAGAINWVPKRAVLGQWDGFVSGTLGTDERRDIRAGVSIPLWSDKLALRVAGADTEFDGTFKNNLPGSADAIRTSVYDRSFRGTGGNVGGYDNYAYQASLRFEPIDALSVNLTYYKSELRYEYGPSVTFAPRSASVVPALGSSNPLNCSPRLTTPAGFTAPYNQLYCGEFEVSESQVVADPRAMGGVADTELYIGQVQYRFSDALSATYVYGHGEYEEAIYGPAGRNALDVLQSGDASPVFPGFPQPGTGNPSLLFGSNPLADQTATSHELRVDGRVGGVTWRLGYYHSKTSDVYGSGLYHYRLPISRDPSGQTLWFSPLLTAAGSLSSFKDQNDGIFGSVAVPIGESWTVEAEARQSKEERSQFPSNLNRTYHDFTPRVNIKWMPRPGWMFYGSVAKGTKAGGFNLANADVKAYDPEQNITYELGGKQALANNRLQLNYAVFFVNWTDLQISVPNAPIAGQPQRSNYIGNVKGATAKGVELEAVWLPTDNWRINLAASYVQSTFKDGTYDTTFGRLCESSVPVCTFAPRSPALPNGGSEIGGNDLARQPRTKGSLGVEYRVPVFSTWELSLRGDVNHQSKFYVENLNMSWLPSRTLLNANVAVTDSKGRWYASLWAKNLTDELYASNALAISTGNNYVPTLGEGRTAGVTLRYNFAAE